MFDYYNEAFFLNRTVFKPDPIISLAILKCERSLDKKKVFPYTNTSTSKSKSIALGKLHSEFLERFKMTYHHRMSKKTTSIKYGDLTQTKINNEALTYGGDIIYGHKDTTGTASGFCSTEIIEKAICELVEKNELMLMWYKKLTYVVEPTQSVVQQIISYGLNPCNVKLFFAQNFNNLFTIICFILNDNGLIIGSGISCDKDVCSALTSSIEEAIMQEWVDTFAKDKIFSQEDPNLKKNFEELCNAKTIDIATLSPVRNIEIDKRFDDIEIVLLNLNGKNQELTVKAISKSLMNCIPVSARIIQNKDKAIVKLFNVADNAESIPECAVV